MLIFSGKNNFYIIYFLFAYLFFLPKGLRIRLSLYIYIEREREMRLLTCSIVKSFMTNISIYISCITTFLGNPVLTNRILGVRIGLIFFLYVKFKLAMVTLDVWSFLHFNIVSFEKFKGSFQKQK
jgi:hypothetical protein